MLIPIEKISNILRDPISKNDLKFEWQDSKIKSVSNNEKSFRLLNNIPILIDFRNSIFDEEFYKDAKMQHSPAGERRQFKKRIKNFLTGTDKNSKKSLSIFRKKLPKISKVLIIGGGNIGSGIDEIYEDTSVELISTDVYPSDKIQFISDCHNIPIKNESVDGVIIQAVLEHVLDPKKVVNEIYRVLKNNGIVLVETPFMQQSHETPYDFNRFTELGHRWLFKSFDAIYRKTNGGPGLSLYWSFKSFIQSIVSNKNISDILSIPFIIFSYIDLFIPEKKKINGANGFVFIGKKSNIDLKEKNIIKNFIGT